LPHCAGANKNPFKSHADIFAPTREAAGKNIKNSGGLLNVYFILNPVLGVKAGRGNCPADNFYAPSIFQNMLYYISRLG
jgi:hypothetical protein